MSKVLFFSVPLQGHTNPSLPLVEELVRRGEEVTYYSLEPLRSAIEDTGATFRSYGASYEALPPPDNAFDGMSRVIIHRSPKILAQLLPEVRDFQPDYILHDALALWGKQFGQILGVPTVCSTPTFVLGTRMWLSAPSMLPELLKERWSARKEVALARNVAQQLQVTYHVKRPSIYEVNVNFGDLTLVYTSKFFHPFSNTFDSSVKFVGPSILPRPEAPAFPFDQLTGSPLIYVSLGTLFTNHLPFFRACVEAFAGSEYQVVMSIGSNVSLADLGPIPANFIVQESIPQLEILQRASLFITHGGMNSASEAIYHGVPLLVIPQAQDQFYVAKRVTKLKAGKMLFMKEVNAQRLRQRARNILADPVYAQNSAKIGVTFHEAGGYMRAADEIAAFKQSLGISHAQGSHQTLSV
jgi:MGT family glycosyltransferase